MNVVLMKKKEFVIVRVYTGRVQVAGEILGSVMGVETAAALWGVIIHV